MYRKQRLTPKLRKKQKIVVSTPQNLWYDTGNNPAQKGKTADMEKVEISGAALAPLFRLSRDAVCGIAQGRIVFSNPAACRLFGADVTGEIAADMLVDAGCKYVILGHSERRAMGETDADVNAKLHTALDAGLIPIVCCGETLAQRESGVTEEWITMQIKLALAGVPEEKIRRIVIAYEPIWAIGTGETATPEQAEEVCQHIRTIIRKRFGSKNARAMTILYGGSMNEKNAFELLAQPDIDGGLIGGASLVPEKFVRIIEDANQPVG